MFEVVKIISLHHAIQLQSFLLRLLRFCFFFCNKRNINFRKLVLRLLQKRQEKTLEFNSMIQEDIFCNLNHAYIISSQSKVIPI